MWLIASRWMSWTTWVQTSMMTLIWECPRLSPHDAGHHPPQP
jgi:hypothetical protein